MMTIYAIIIKAIVILALLLAPVLLMPENDQSIPDDEQRYTISKNGGILVYPQHQGPRHPKGRIRR